MRLDDEACLRQKQAKIVATQERHIKAYQQSVGNVACDRPKRSHSVAIRIAIPFVT